MIAPPVPEWLRLVSDLKARPPEQLLTDTQRAVCDTLLRLLEFPEWVNLRGPAGAGKTFLAWALARQTGALHLPLPQQTETLSPAAPCVLIDNAPVSEASLRVLLARCTLAGVRKVLVITRAPVQMPMRHVDLPLPTDADWAQIEQTFQRLGVLLPPPRTHTLWEFLRACCD